MREVAIDERAHGQPHAIFGEAAHFEQTRLQLLELFLKVSDMTFCSIGASSVDRAVGVRGRRSRRRAQPNRPVT